jgi:D-alanine transaminase
MSEITYFNGSFLPKAEVHLSPDDRGFLFSDGVYEVVRSYGGALFETEAHLERLADSLSAMMIAGVDVAALSTVCEGLLERNGLAHGDALVYLQVTRGAAPRTHQFPEPPVAPTVYGCAWAFDPPHRPEDGAAAVTVPDQRWARCDIKTVALIPNCMANQRAREAAAEEALFVRDGVVLEGTHTNFFGVFLGVARTAPLTNYILAGVTRRVVLELCEEIGVEVEERAVLAEELGEAHELFMVGTTAEVTAILTLDGRTVGNGRPGSIAIRLLAALRERAGSGRPMT